MANCEGRAPRAGVRTSAGASAGRPGRCRVKAAGADSGGEGGTRRHRPHRRLRPCWAGGPGERGVWNMPRFPCHREAQSGQVHFLPVWFAQRSLRCSVLAAALEECGV